MTVSYASVCSRLGCKIDLQIEGVASGNKTPAMIFTPFGSFWGAIWDVISGTGKRLIVDFNFDPAVFRTSIDRVIWLYWA